MELMELSALELGKLLRDKKVSCKEAAEYFIDRINKSNPHLNAYVSVFEERAFQDAENAQKRINSGDDISCITGVPMAINDNICVNGLKTTCCSNILSNFTPPYSATVFDKLSNAGAVLLGKLNIDEFDMGGTTETSFYGAASNPWDTSKVPGGSSGGSSVAAGLSVYALGSDTGGSIRQSSAFCGTAGIKPTYGSVSRHGLVAYASSLEQIGSIGKNIQDCAEVLSIISGRDNKDGTSVIDNPFDFSGCYGGDIKGLKIGVPNDCFREGTDEDVKRAIYEAIRLYESLGASVEEFEMKEYKMPALEYASAAHSIIACAEASSNMSRYDGIKYGLRWYESSEAEHYGNSDLINLYINTRSHGFGMEVKRRIMLGSFVLSSDYYEEYYKKGLQVRGAVKKSFSEIFDKYNIILCPTTPGTAFKKGEVLNDPLKAFMGDIYTVSANLAGLPAASVPCGLDSGGMPIGMQLIGNAFNEDIIIKAAYAFELNRKTNIYILKNENIIHCVGAKSRLITIGQNTPSSGAGLPSVNEYVFVLQYDSQF